MHILHLNQRNQRNQILFQYLRDKKKNERRGLRKRGGENSPISPPLDPRPYGSSSALRRPVMSRSYCLYILGSLSNDDGDCNENVKKAKQQLCTRITLFVHFFAAGRCSTNA